MTPKLKEKWIKALRSGDYAQGAGLLCRFDEDGEARYCCLGVLHEVKHGPGAWTQKGSVLVTSDSSSVDLPISLCPQPIQSNGIRRNDAGHSFDQIADWLEQTK